jgi:hypothetical protein
MRIVSLIDGPAVIERILRHLGLWQQGIRVASGPAPPADWVIEPCFDDATPDYETDSDPIYVNGSSIAAGPVCLFSVTGTQTSGFGPVGGYPFRPKAAGLWRSNLVLKFLPDSATLPSMTSLLQTGFGMISAYAGRCRPKSDFLSIFPLLVALALFCAGCIEVRSDIEPPSAVPATLLDLTATPESIPPETLGPLQGGRLQAFLEGTRCFTNLPRRAHTPEFRLVRVSEWKYRREFYWIMDGQQQIGLLNLWIGEIEMFRFFPPAGELVRYRMPAVQHWATIQGPRITMVPQGTWTNMDETACLQQGGETLRLRCRKKLEDRSEMTQYFTLRFDPVLGYIWDCRFQLQSERPLKFEYTNLLTGGLSESRERRKRYQKCIWTRRDGTLCYMYQNPLSMVQSGGPAWTDAPEDGGFFGWVAERDMNPFLEILQSAPRATFVTCSQWYDQHVFNLLPVRTGADGLYHVTAAYRMLSLPLPAAKELEDAARTMLPTSSGEAPVGFRQGVVNDFEKPIPAGTLYNGAMWGGGAGLDTRLGHSGSRSLRVGGGSAAEPIAGGTAIYVETGKRYRLSAWVRTRGVTGKGAYLRVNEVFFSWADVRATHRSKALTGDNDWTRLELEFEPGAGDPFGVPGLVVEGRGTAWFDDLEMVEIPREGSR